MAKRVPLPRMRPSRPEDEWSEEDEAYEPEELYDPDAEEYPYLGDGEIEQVDPLADDLTWDSTRDMMSQLAEMLANQIEPRQKYPARRVENIGRRRVFSHWDNANPLTLPDAGVSLEQVLRQLLDMSRRPAPVSPEMLGPEPHRGIGDI